MFASVLIAAAVRRPGRYRVIVRFERLEYAVGDTASAVIQARRAIRPPAVLIRVALPLRTLDGRSLNLSCDPERSAEARGPVGKRGAFFAPNDMLSVRDAFGFFAAERPLRAEDGPRLCVLPGARLVSMESVPESGGEALRAEPRFSKTDELTESRKYVPGDDPRRINWKLYGHSGELFVRDGENEPPPRSRYAVIVDSSVDPVLFPGDAGLDAVDALAETALGLVGELLTAGLDVECGALGLPLERGDDKAAASFFSKITVYGIDASSDLPAPNEPKTKTILLALPRRIASEKPTALDRFLEKRRETSVSVDLAFAWISYDDEDDGNPKGWRRFLLRDVRSHAASRRRGELPAEAAEACVGAYAAMGGVRARRLEI